MSENGRDPFRGILALVREEASGQIHSTFVVGKVLAADQGSIRIQADGHELDEEDILINAALAPGFTETARVTLPAGSVRMSGQLSGSIAPCATGSGHSGMTVSAYSGSIECETGTLRVPFRLRAGDLVLLMPDESRQLYYLICKVVRYGTVSAD